MKVIMICETRLLYMDLWTVRKQWNPTIYLFNLIIIFFYIDAGTKCIVYSTLNVFKLYNGAPQVVRPAALLSCLAQIMGAGFVKGSQQCSAEFFQSLWQIFEEKARYLQSIHHIPQYCSLKFLDSFSFSLSSEILCNECDNITTNSATETVLPLSITKVYVYLKYYTKEQLVISMLYPCKH